MEKHWTADFGQQMNGFVVDECTTTGFTATYTVQAWHQTDGSYWTPEVIYFADVLDTNASSWSNDAVVTIAESVIPLTRTEVQNPFIDGEAGGNLPSVSVGDLVWLDTDRDGIQDAGEPGLPGVTLTLTGPDGAEVTGIDGAVVGPVVSGADGTYAFTGLPVLPAGQSYTVTAAPPAEGYEPTTPGAGADRAADSSTGSATSGDLTQNGAADMTLDFGFVTPVGMPTTPAPTTPEPSTTPRVPAPTPPAGPGTLPATGAGVVPLLGLAGAALAAGTVLLALRPRS